MTRRIFTTGILLFPDAEELDWAGPLEVFGMATQTIEDARVVTVAESTEPVRCFNGLRVLPDYDFANVPDHARQHDARGQQRRRSPYARSLCFSQAVCLASRVAALPQVVRHQAPLGSEYARPWPTNQSSNQRWIEDWVSIES